jgi:hypothetical protein
MHGEVIGDVFLVTRRVDRRLGSNLTPSVATMTRRTL